MNTCVQAVCGIAVAMTMAVVSVSGCATMQRNATATTGAPGQTVSFSLTDAEGGDVRLADARGSIVLLSFWASWCTPCKEEIPLLQDLQDRYADQGLKIMLVNVDTPDKLSEARAYIASLGITMTALFDPDSSTTGFLNPDNDLPFALMVDRQGREIYRHHGFAPGDETELEDIVKTALAN